MRRPRVVDLVGQIPNHGLEVAGQVVVRRLLQERVREEVGVGEPAEAQAPAALVEAGHLGEPQIRLLVVAAVDGVAQGVEVRVEAPQTARRERHEHEEHEREDETDQVLERPFLVEKVRQCHVSPPCAAAGEAAYGLVPQNSSAANPSGMPTTSNPIASNRKRP